MISCMVVARRDKRRDFILMYFIIHIYIYMIGVYLCVIFLAHPICLCLAMIVYAVHVSR